MTLYWALLDGILCCSRLLDNQLHKNHAIHTQKLFVWHYPLRRRYFYHCLPVNPGPRSSYIDRVSLFGFSVPPRSSSLKADASSFISQTKKNKALSWWPQRRAGGSVRKPQNKCYQDEEEEKEKKKHPTIKPKCFLFIKIYVWYHKNLDCFAFL